eukprot:m.115924 g.115924  ORF g.115924 m.115924 type:complete len:211 (-) comp28466_c0_seq1:227-859(-)
MLLRQILLVTVVCLGVVADNTTETPATTVSIVPTSVVPTTPAEDPDGCGKAKNCGDCAGFKKNCYWCPFDAQKEDFQKTNTNKTECFHNAAGAQGLVECEHCASQDQCKTRVCFVSMKLLVIIVPSVAGGLILIFGIWIWCCCRKRSKRKLKTFQMKETKKDKLSAKRREERSQVRKAERREKTSGLRAKYGLQADDSDDEKLVGEDDGW